MIGDKDLISMQQARILAENAAEAQKKLAGMPQEALDAVVEAMADAVEAEAQSLAVMSQEESGCGVWQDKLVKNLFVCRRVRQSLRGLRCVGLLDGSDANGVYEVGVPLGVVAALCPATSPVSTAVCTALLAVKSGNAVIFSPHPRVLNTLRRVTGLLAEAAQARGLPEGALSCLDMVTTGGAHELMRHPHVSLLLASGVPSLYAAARASGKPFLCGNPAGGPAFIERSAHIDNAVEDILASKAFDNGLAPSAEQCVIVDGCVEDEVRRAFTAKGAYFMSEGEADALVRVLFSGAGADGCRQRHRAGQSAAELARHAGFALPAGTRVLMAPRSYVIGGDAYTRELLAPVLAYYVEPDWKHACEKCVELLIEERHAQTLSIHSRQEDVIRQFALKKPVARLLVNTGAAFGGMGLTTNFTPAMTLGGTADNISPAHFTYRRKIGHGVRGLAHLANFGATGPDSPAVAAVDAERQDPRLNTLRHALRGALSTLQQPR